MVRVLAGMVTGVVVSGAVLAAVSVVVDLSEREARRESAPEAGEVRVPAGSGFGGDREDRDAALPLAGDGPEPLIAPRIPTPAPDDTDALRGADTAPSSSPGVGAAPVLDAPQAPADDATSRPSREPVPAGRTPLPAQPAAPTPDASADGSARPAGDP